jgi:hypothetical protein
LGGGAVGGSGLNATPNTGGGGGGDSVFNTNIGNGSGGSGIVIVSYLTLSTTQGILSNLVSA